MAELSWQPLSQLGTLPLDALVPLHGLCCWLVGYCFEDAADHGGRVQVCGGCLFSTHQFSAAHDPTSLPSSLAATKRSGPRAVV